MSADPIIDWFLVDRYCGGMVTPAERTELEHWIAAGADRQETIRRIQAAVHARSHRPQRRDWHRTEAIETVLTRVQEGRLAPVIPTLPRQPHSAGRSTTAKIAERLRHWFDGATELAVAMLLDADEEPLSDAETKVLRDQINDRQREPHAR